MPDGRFPSNVDGCGGLCLRYASRRSPRLRCSFLQPPDASRRVHLSCRSPILSLHQFLRYSCGRYRPLRVLLLQVCSVIFSASRTWDVKRMRILQVRHRTHSTSVHNRKHLAECMPANAAHCQATNGSPTTTRSPGLAKALMSANPASNRATTELTRSLSRGDFAESCPTCAPFARKSSYRRTTSPHT